MSGSPAVARRSSPDASALASQLASMALDALPRGHEDSIYERMKGIVSNSLQNASEEPKTGGGVSEGDNVGVRFNVSDSCNDSCKWLFCCMFWKCCSRQTTNIMVVNGSKHSDRPQLTPVKVLQEDLDSETMQGRIVRSHQKLYEYLLRTYGEELSFIYAVVARRLGGRWLTWNHNDPSTFRGPLVQGDVRTLLETLEAAHRAVGALREAKMREDLQALERDMMLSNDRSGDFASNVHRIIGHMEASAAVDEGAGVSRMVADDAAGVGPAAIAPVSTERQIVGTQTTASLTFTPTARTSTNSPAKRLGSGSSGSNQSRVIMIVLGELSDPSAPKIKFSRLKLASDIAKLVNCSDEQVQSLVDEIVKDLPEEVNKTLIWNEVRRKIREKGYPIRETAQDQKIKEALIAVGITTSFNTVSDLPPDKFAEFMTQIGRTTTLQAHSGSSLESVDRWGRIGRWAHAVSSVMRRSPRRGAGEGTSHQIMSVSRQGQSGASSTAACTAATDYGVAHEARLATSHSDTSRVEGVYELRDIRRSPQWGRESEQLAVSAAAVQSEVDRVDDAHVEQSAVVRPGTPRNVDENVAMIATAAQDGAGSMGCAHMEQAAVDRPDAYAIVDEDVVMNATEVQSDMGSMGDAHVEQAAVERSDAPEIVEKDAILETVL